MNSIPRRDDYYLSDGGFILKSKSSKWFRLGVMIGVIVGGISASSVTSSNIETFSKELIFQKTPEAKVIDYIQTANTDITHEDAISIVQSTYKWAKEFEVDPLLLVAVQKVESRFNKYSMSSTGALGIMQVIPSWHLSKMSKAIKDVGNPELFNINTNIYLGSWVLKDCFKKHNLQSNALRCYNGSNASPNGYENKVASAHKELVDFVKG